MDLQGKFTWQGSPRWWTTGERERPAALLRLVSAVRLGSPDAVINTVRQGLHILSTATPYV